jgi:malate synthase
MSLPITTSDIEVLGRGGDTDARVLTPDALAFVADLHRELDPIRRQLLAARAERRERIAAGELPGFPEGTRHVRDDATWRVAPAPRDLLDWRVELTGPVDRKMVINALNSGAQMFMADFEAANSPTWLGPGYEAAAEVFVEVALSDEFVEFLTLPAYERLIANGKEPS